MRVSCGIFVGMLSLASASAADIEGHVTVTHKLTKRTVTVAASYERGVSVEPGAIPGEYPLAIERTYVVVYLEGQTAFDASRRDA